LLRYISIAEKVPEITGLSELTKVTKEQAENAKNLAAQQKALIDIEIKLSNAIKAEQQAKQSIISTDTKSINQSKAEQQAKNTEIQGRIKNAQAIAAEERATQAGIRTSRLQQSQHTKTTSSFTRLAYSLRTYIAAYASLQSIMGVVGSVFKQTKELDSLSFSMKTIIKDSNELAQTQIFLSDTAKNYGLNILSMSERYLRFRAATIQSNMTAKETQKIFDSVSRAASVLGLRTDEVAGVYLALEQMISKGKVTTEELRRQLGERLSGAFGIFAAAIGVSTVKLDEMLKKGQVLSSDVLPKFADQLLKAYGIENVTRVDNLAAAQGRLNTSWTEFIKSLKAASLFATTFNILADTVERINSAIKSDSSKVSERGAKLMSQSVEKLSEGQTIQERQAILTKQILDLEQQRNKISERLVKNESKRPSFLEKTFSGLNQALGLGGEFTASIMFEQVYQDTILDDKAYKEAIDNLKKNFDKLVIPPIKNKQVVSDKDKSKGNQFTPLEKMQDTHKIDLENAAKYQQELLSNTELSESQILQAKEDNAKELIRIRMDQINEEKKISGLSKEQISTLDVEYSDQEKKIAKITSDFIISEQKRLNKEIIDEEKKKADEIKKIREKLTDDTISDANAEADIQKLRLQEVAIGEIKSARNNKDKISEIQHELTKNMIAEDIAAQDAILLTKGLEEKAYERARIDRRRLQLQANEEDISWTDKTEEEKKQIKEQTLQATNALLQQGLAFSQQIYSAQADRAQATYNAEIEAAGSSLEEQTLAKRKFEAEDKKIKQRQAIASKLQAIFDAGLALALAIATTWENPLLAALNIGAATIGLGMAVSTPLPQFADGVENFEGGLAVLGDGKGSKKGPELVTEPSGKKWLSSDSPTVYNLASGSTVKPADETQRILANMAFNQVKEVVDMGATNNYLSKIAKNTKQSPVQYTDNRGKTVIKRGSLISTI